MDPTKIKKVREVNKEKDPKTGVDIVKKINEYYVYNEKGLAHAGYGELAKELKLQRMQ